MVILGYLIRKLKLGKYGHSNKNCKQILRRLVHLWQIRGHIVAHICISQLQATIAWLSPLPMIKSWLPTCVSACVYSFLYFPLSRVYPFMTLAEIGDFIKEEYRDIGYLRNLKILHEPNDDRLRRVMDFHKNHM